MQDQFQTMSDQIIGRIDDMSSRIDDLEKNIADLMTQAGLEELDGENKIPATQKRAGGCLSLLESGTPFYKPRGDRWLFQLTTMCRQVLYYKVCILLTTYYRVSLWSDFPPQPPMFPKYGDFTYWTLVSCAIKH